MFQLAKLFVDIEARDDRLKRQMEGVKGQLSSFGTAIGVAAGNLASSAISSAAGSLANFIGKGIGGASNLAESISKVNAVFGAAAGSITGLADDMAKEFGLPKQAMIDAAASIGLVGKAAGQSEADAAGMAVTMAKMAADASSFYNVPLDTALEKIRAGLVGESEPLRAFGVLLNEAAVANEAVAMGLARSTKEVDDHAKVMARASLISRGLADATGDLERTAGSTANQWRKFQGTMENTAVSIGTSLAPAISELTSSFASLATDMAAAVEENKATIAGWAESIGASIRAVPQYWDEFQAGLTVAVLNVDEFVQNTGAYFDAFAQNAGLVGGWFSAEWPNLFRDGANAVMTIFGNLAENLSNIWGAFLEFVRGGEFRPDFKPLLEGFKAATAALPEMVKPKLVSMEGAIAIVGEDLARKAEARAKAAVQAAAGPAKVAKAIATAAPGKAFKAEVSTGEEAYFKLRAASLGGKDDTAKQQLATQKKTEEHTAKMARLLDRGLPAVLG